MSDCLHMVLILAPVGLQSFKTFEGEMKTFDRTPMMSQC